MSSARSALAACLLAACLLAAQSSPSAAQEAALIVPISIGVVQTADGHSADGHSADGHSADGRVVDDSWIDARLVEANRVFAPTGVVFVRADTYALPAEHARAESRADRNALGAFVRPGVINLFVVATLMDVDEPGRERRGVHWRDRGAGTHYVIVSAIAEWPAIFAHELGHFFGEPHSSTPNDVMSYEHDDLTPPFLDRAQVRRIRRRARAMLDSAELVTRR